MNQEDLSGHGTVREMAEEEKREVRSIMIRCFGRFAGLFFDFGDQAFVYEWNGRIVGGVTLSAFSVGKGRGGVVKWLFTLPEARGRGAAGAMLDRSMEWFRKQGCDWSFACVEGYNTASSNLFARRGYDLLSFSRQLKLFGKFLPVVWLRCFHTVDIGHFLWMKFCGTEPEGKKPVRETGWLSGLAVTMGLHCLYGYLAMIRQGQSLFPGLIWQIPLAAFLIPGIRFFVMKTAATKGGVPLVYRPWETGLLLSGAIALLPGGIFVVPGNLYPERRIWNYRDALPELGRVAFAGTAVLLVAALALEFLFHSGTLPDAARTAAWVLLTYLKILLLFDVVFVFFPFQGFNGSRVRDWSWKRWLILLTGTIVLWVWQLLSGWLL